ncbi:MAG: alpha/beta hydrolase [Cryobacterium sp.]|nr:alpha/beta hydrolase [Cryobacterium sp.]
MRDPDDLGKWFADLADWDAARLSLPQAPLETVRYGDDPDQRFDLWASHATGGYREIVIGIHGGYFLQEYDSSLHTAMSRQLAADGFAIVNLQYRRGTKGRQVTLADLDLALDRVLELYHPLTMTVFGHSAGGYLAEIMASRPEIDLAVLLAPVTDLAEASRENWDEGGIVQWLGAGLEEDPVIYADAALTCNISGHARRVIIHGSEDTAVAASQSRSLSAALERAGIPHELLELPGEGHYGYLDPREPAFETLRSALRM